MKVNVGSKNSVKVDAVREAFADFPEFSKADVVSVEVSSGVHNQPKNIAETTEGAVNRAKAAFKNCDYSVGIESGIMKMPHTKSGYIGISMCAIYDGKRFHIGGSSMFEYPKSMIDLVLQKDYEIDDAAKEVGIAHDAHIGERDGMIGFLTKGKINRKAYSKQSVTNALIHLLNPEHY